MRKTQVNKKSKNKKLKAKQLASKKSKITKIKINLNKLQIKGKERWVARKKALSPYPYILTISSFRRNVFFNVATIEGDTKAVMSVGAAGFKSKDKTTNMALIKVAEMFWKKIWGLGIRQMILRFRNFYRRGKRFAIRRSLKKNRAKYPFKFLGIISDLDTSFNGCRRKKKRRK